MTPRLDELAAGISVTTPPSSDRWENPAMQQHSVPRRFRVAAAVLFALATGSCGGTSEDATGSDSTAVTTPDPTTTTAEPTTTTTALLDELSGLRLFEEGEGCPTVLAMLNSPEFPAEAKAQVGFGYSHMVADGPVADLSAAPDRESFGNSTTFWLATGSAAQQIQGTEWQQLYQATRRPPGEPNWWAEFELLDGAYACSEVPNVGAE